MEMTLSELYSVVATMHNSVKSPDTIPVKFYTLVPRTNGEGSVDGLDVYEDLGAVDIHLVQGVLEDGRMNYSGFKVEVVLQQDPPTDTTGFDPIEGGEEPFTDPDWDDDYLDPLPEV